MSARQLSCAGPLHACARLLLAIVVLVISSACSPDTKDLGTAEYERLHFAARCTAGEKAGAAGATNDLLTSDNVRFNVRTSRNYDARLAHPLLIVLPPAGYPRNSSEKYYDLSRAATGAGFIVVYPDHLGLSERAFAALGKIPAIVSARWCIDERRVYFAGHSDGGTSSGAIAFRGTSQPAPRALVISGAGIRGQDLSRERCPAPTSALIIHSVRDERFPPPEYGVLAAGWWASCNRCSQQVMHSELPGCIEYARCKARTAYCAVDTPHTAWPPVNATVLKFLGAGSPAR